MDHQGLIAAMMYLNVSVVLHNIQNIILGSPGLISIERRRISEWVECDFDRSV
jgi:hypothetical protein